MDAMAGDVQAIAVAIEEGKRFERAERERRIGLTYVLSGTSFILVFGLYGGLMLAPWPVPMVVFALAWMPFVAAGGYVRRRYFRHLPTSAREFWGISQAEWWIFLALFVGIGVGVGSYGPHGWVWPAESLAIAALYLVQAARRRDAIHASLAGVVVVAGLAVLPLAPGWQAIVLGAAIGSTLLVVGALRYRRGRSL